MLRQADPYEKIIFDIIKEYNHRFYYEGIYRVVDEDQFKVKIEKHKEEMVGHAYVTFPDNDHIEYEVRYNRIVNLSEGYTLMIPKVKAL
ncbi:MAG: hypothetical protein N3I35_17550 [Clostridia bacterium]|nr:hypothetical protein [Clostridia bacterium]